MSPYGHLTLYRGTVNTTGGQDSAKGGPGGVSPTPKTPRKVSAAAEPVQNTGRQGVFAAKKWLEATTHVKLTWNCYDTPVHCTLPLLDGSTKLFDLAGTMLGSPRPVVVESKRYSTAGRQAAAYTEYLAHAYSSTVRGWDIFGGDEERQFFWVTWHPFSQTKWPQLVSHTEVSEALKEHPGALAGRSPDEDVLRLVADRLWLIVLHERQEELTLTEDELHLVMAQLKRTGY